MRQLRSKIIRFRVSESELEKINSQIPLGVGMSTWIRERLGQTCPTSNEDQRRLIAQVAKVGNNLNQIARGINSANASGTRFELIQVHQVLRRIDEQLKEVLK